MIKRIAVIFLYFSNLVVGKFTGWVDPDTPTHLKTLYSHSDGQEYKLVMSDEFNRDGRSFKNGDDPMWTGIDRSDDDQTSNGRRSLQFYNSSYINTRDGNLVIRTTDEDTKWRGWNPYLKKYVTMSRNFRSGMLQSWNKFCYTGGILEVRVQFPGRSDIGGLWPAVWLLGNLGRATFEASTNLMWPWSYNECNPALQHAQEISACDVTSHFGLNEKQGRGATEIDIIEVMPGPSTPLPLVKNNLRRPYCSMTLQLAPGVPASKKRPQSGTLPEWGFHWYQNITYGKNTSINPFFYGSYLAPTKTAEPVSRSQKESYQCDAISSMVQLNDSHFEGMHVFRLEWQPGEDGYIRWYMDDEFRFGIDAAGLREQNTHVPNEPSYVILNTAISTSWGFPNPPPGCTEYDCKDPAKQCGMNPGWCKTLPAEFKIDYIRIYQNPSDPRQTIGCNPKEYPTKRFIKAHEFRYKGLGEKEALKPIKSGGGACNQNHDCGDFSGRCIMSVWKFYSNKGFKGCVCQGDWQGPNCLVPTYQNPFPDWDTEPHVSWVSPFIPHFLALWVVLFFIALGATLVFAWRWRHSKRAAHLEALALGSSSAMLNSSNISSGNREGLWSTTSNSSAGAGAMSSSTSSSWAYQQIPSTEMTSLGTTTSRSAGDKNSSSIGSTSHHPSHRSHPEYSAASTHHPNQTLYQAL